MNYKNLLGIHGYIILRENMRCLMTKILGSSKVTVRYQVTIPEEVREQLKIQAGQTIGFVEENGKICLVTEF